MVFEVEKLEAVFYSWVMFYPTVCSFAPVVDGSSIGVSSSGIYL